jgi:hypothetical protein
MRGDDRQAIRTNLVAIWKLDQKVAGPFHRVASVQREHESYLPLFRLSHAGSTTPKVREP